MPKFPTKETQIAALAYKMFLGYAYHIADFPSIDVEGVNMIAAAYFGYTVARNAQKLRIAAVRAAAKSRNASLKALKQRMNGCLKKSAVDVAGDPTKLEYIGWSPKARRRPADTPGQPVNLRSIAEGPGTIRLKWDRPARNCSGPVRNFVIERREQPARGGDFGPWQISGTSFNNDITLTGQPCRIQLEYRVKAINSAGQSVSSNVVCAVL